MKGPAVLFECLLYSEFAIRESTLSIVDWDGCTHQANSPQSSAEHLGCNYGCNGKAGQNAQGNEYHSQRQGYVLQRNSLRFETNNKEQIIRKDEKK